MSMSSQGRISAADVRSATFEIVGQGYDREAVHQFLQSVSDQMEADQIRMDARGANAQDEMVKIITQAQVLAEKFVEEAEQYSKDLVASARTQYSEILRRAELNASQRSGGAVEPAAAAGAPVAYTEPIQEIEYVRTYTKVAQVQLRAVIDALAEQVDRLGDLPAAKAARNDKP